VLNVPHTSQIQDMVNLNGKRSNSCTRIWPAYARKDRQS
jgi:hypothetical protein